MKICVYCSSAEGLPGHVYEKGEAFGRSLAQRGHTLVYGGYNKGLMGAVARGAVQGGGEVIGVVPHIFDRPGFTLPGCSRVVLTETMAQRKAAMEAEGDAFAVLPGGIGTFDEFFEVLVLKALGQLHKPLAIYNMNGLCDALQGLLRQGAADGMLSSESLALAPFYTDGEALLDALTQKS